MTLHTATEPAETPTEDDPTSLAARYLLTRGLTEELASPLSAEDQTVQSMPDVSPTKWHRAHTTWFFETFVLAPERPHYVPFHPAYRYLFNSYYETVGPRHARHERGLLSRPGIEEIGRYRSHVDAVMTALLAGPSPTAAALTDLGIHHEQQHQELLLMDIKHVLSVNPLDPPYRPTAAGTPGAGTSGLGAPSSWIDHPGGQVAMGHQDGGFCFDNETPTHQALLRPFALADRLVTCGEWLTFMEDDGYRRPELWLSDGWSTVQRDGWAAPLYWEPDGDAWTVFTLGGRRPVDPAEPVCHVSYYEADAFAHWTGTRLPTEAEWEAVARSVGADTGRGLDLDVLHPRPASGDGQWSGEVWQWTASSYSPYPGFRANPGAVGEYNGKFMVNQQVLRGGACVTPPGHSRVTYRNFFPPGARWAFSGLRLARDND